MQETIPPFTGRNTSAVNKLNVMREQVNRTGTIMGDGFNLQLISQLGQTNHLSIEQLIARVRGGTGSGIHLAYCKTAAGAASTITCYKDTDATGDEITVNCSIAGGGNLNSAVPRLTDGLAVLVTEIGTDWWCLTVFQKSEDCTCT